MFIVCEVSNQKFIKWITMTLYEKYTSNILDNVKNKLKELNKIIIFNILNQWVYLKKGPPTKSRYTIDFGAIGIPIQIFYSTEDDEYRKPMRGGMIY